MVTINVSQLSIWIGVVGAMAGALVFGYKLVRRMEKTEDLTVKNDELNKVVIKSLFACLDGLHQLGCNGEVTKARESLKEHVIEK